MRTSSQPAAAAAISSALREHSAVPRTAKNAATALLNLSASSDASLEAVVSAYAAESAVAALRACTVDASRRSSADSAGTSGALEAAAAVSRLLVSLCSKSAAARHRAGAASAPDALAKALTTFSADATVARQCASGVGALMIRLDPCAGLALCHRMDAATDTVQSASNSHAHIVSLEPY